jgi:hypothetical protein
LAGDLGDPHGTCLVNRFAGLGGGGFSGDDIPAWISMRRRRPDRQQHPPGRRETIRNQIRRVCPRVRGDKSRQPAPASFISVGEHSWEFAPRPFADCRLEAGGYDGGANTRAILASSVRQSTTEFMATAKPW